MDTFQRTSIFIREYMLKNKGGQSKEVLIESKIEDIHNRNLTGALSPSNSGNCDCCCVGDHRRENGDLQSGDPGHALCTSGVIA